MGARDSGEGIGELRARLEGLAGAVAGLSFVSGTEAGRREARTLERAGRLLSFKLLPEVERAFAPPLVAAVAGGTNVGKSSLFNAILDQHVSSVDPRAGHTAHPVAAGPASARGALEAFLSGYTVAATSPQEAAGRGGDAAPGEPTVLLTETESPGGAVLVDSPDVDSTLEVHHQRAEDALAAADILLLVTSPTKYNDRRCVEFLMDAAAMGKRVVVLFNLLPPHSAPDGQVGETVTTEGPRDGQTRGGGPRREVLDDFRTSVLGKLPKGAVAPVLFEFDALGQGRAATPAASDAPRQGGAGGDNRPTALAEALAERALEARAYLKVEAARAGAVKREVAAGGARYLARSLKGTLKALREQATSIEAVRAELEGARSRAAADYEAFLRGREFLGLELVLERLLNRFRVPVLDDVLDFASAIPKKLAGAILRRPSLDERRKEQAKVARAKEIELVSRARVEFARALESRAPDEVARKLYGEIVSVDYFDLDLESAWSGAEQERKGALDAWLAALEGELASRIESAPGLRVTVQSLKAVLELGAGIAAAVLTGGIGAGDILIGGAATKAAQFVFMKLGREYFRSKREEYLALARSTFADGLDEVFLARLREAIPASPRTVDVDSVERELGWLAQALPAAAVR